MCVVCVCVRSHVNEDGDESVMGSAMLAVESAMLAEESTILCSQCMARWLEKLHAGLLSCK